MSRIIQYWWRWRLAHVSWLAIVGAIAISGDCALAQITPDGTLGAESSVVTPQAPGSTVDVIQGGATRGTNLFHSFEQFSIPTGGAAYFNNALDIQNIISRVTGESISNIDGLIRANGTANLFLLNPNGIIFGPNASLNIGGSFLGSTASSLNFADGTNFSTTDPQTPSLLTVSVPVGLQFGRNPGSIVNQSQAQSLSGETNSQGGPVGLQVPTGQTLALVGGNVILEGGNLTAAGGRIELGSVAGVGEVSLSKTDNSWVIGYDETDAFGDIQMEGGLLVDASGSGGGDVQIQSAKLEVTKGADIFADTYGIEDGGDVFLHTTEAIAVSDGSSITADVFGAGSGGDLTIDTGQLIIRDGAQVTTRTFGAGSAGTLAVEARESVEVIGRSADGRNVSGLATGVSTGVARGATGNGGNLIMKTGRLIIRDGAQVLAATFGAGSAGTLAVEAHESVDLSGTTADGQNISALATGAARGATGNGNNLTVKTGRLIIRNGAEISAATFGAGSAGNLVVEAHESVELSGRSADGRFGSSLSTSVQPGATGAGGNLTLDTGQLIVQNGARVSTGTFGAGSAGTLEVRASDSVELIGESADGQFSSYLSTSGQPGATGDGGNLTVETRRLIIRDGAQVSTGTFGAGSAGTLEVSASDSVELIGTSQFNSQIGSVLSTSVQPGATGDGGNLTLETRQLIVRNGAQVFAGTSGTGSAGTLEVRASESVELIGTSANSLFASGLLTSVQRAATGDSGNLIVETRRLIVRDGAEVSAGTLGEGAAGNLEVRAFESVELIGTSANGQYPSGLTALTRSTGDAGDLRIEAGQLTVRDRAQVSVSSEGSGIAGQLRVTANSIQMNNQGAFTAITKSGNGGDITLQVRDLLLLRRGSEISTTAGTEQAGGNGGNMAINASNGFIVAVRGENSDITANAFTGSGGRVQINASGIFGMEVRSREDLVSLLLTNDPTKLDPRLLPTSDITAISQTSPTLSGLVTINTPDIDPSSGLVNLPEVPVDIEVAQGCTAGSSQAQSEFIITGHGGLPPNPGEPLSTDAVMVDLITLNPEVDRPSTIAVATSPTSSTPARIVEAQGWAIGANGNVVLIANAATVTPHSSWQTPANCHVPKTSS